MIKLKKMHLALFFLALSIILITYLFGVTGFRTIGCMLLIFFLPSYIIIQKLPIEKDEKVFFSFFIGIAMFPLLVWCLNRIVPSLRMSMMVMFVLLVGIGLFLIKYETIKYLYKLLYLLCTYSVNMNKMVKIKIFESEKLKLTVFRGGSGMLEVKEEFMDDSVSNKEIDNLFDEAYEKT